MFRSRPYRKDRWWCQWNTDDRHFTSWTDMQDVVPARALISSRTPRANADALSNMLHSPSFRHSPVCGSRSVWSPFILRFISDCKVTKDFWNEQEINERFLVCTNPISTLCKEYSHLYIFSNLYKISPKMGPGTLDGLKSEFTLTKVPL